MKLYPKKISSLQQLKREQAKLRKKIASGQQNDRNVEAPPTSGNAIIDVLSELLSPSSAAGKGGGISLGLPLLELAASQLQKGFLKKVAVEFVGGYLKWKAVQFAFKGVKKIVRSQKAKAKLKHNR